MSETRQEYEYGVMFHRDRSTIHRGPMSEREARDWIRSGMEPEGTFVIVRREVGRWQRVVPDE